MDFRMLGFLAHLFWVLGFGVTLLGDSLIYTLNLLLFWFYLYDIIFDNWEYSYYTDLITNTSPPAVKTAPFRTPISYGGQQSFLWNASQHHLSSSLSRNKSLWWLGLRLDLSRHSPPICRKKSYCSGVHRINGIYLWGKDKDNNQIITLIPV